MACDGTDYLGSLRLLLGQDPSRLHEIRTIQNEPATARYRYDCKSKMMNLFPRTFSQTKKNGTLGIGPPGMIPGDKSFHSIEYPDDFTLRQVGDHYRVIGDARIARAELPPYSDGGYQSIETY